MADQEQSDAIEKGLAQPLLLGSQDNQQDENADQECDGSEEAPENSRLPATSIASAYRLLTPSVKVCFESSFGFQSLAATTLME